MTTETHVTAIKPDLQAPPFYKVIIFNDDITTFQCVIDILVSYFNKSEDDAYNLTFEANGKGTAVVGVYPKDIAKTKIALAIAELKIKNYPLRIEAYKNT